MILKIILFFVISGIIFFSVAATLFVHSFVEKLSLRAELKKGLKSGESREWDAEEFKRRARDRKDV